jgi:hypothetical protein
VICKICGLKFKEINNDHVQKHNMNCDEYDVKFGKNSRTSEKTRINKNTLGPIMSIELSNKLSNSHKIENYISKYGNVEGLIRFNLMMERKKYKNGKQSYIDRFGENADFIYNEVQKKKAITLKNCIDKHGLIDGENIYNKWRELQKSKNFLSYYIDKYGYETGLEKWLDKNNKISLSNSKIEKEDKNKFINYIYDVNKYTRLSLNKYNIDGIELRGKEFGYDLDHIYSKVDGFKNGIPSYIIGHISNLRIVESSYNRRKRHVSDIEIEYIISEYENDIEYKKLINDIEKIKNNG